MRIRERLNCELFTLHTTTWKLCSTVNNSHLSSSLQKLFKEATSPGSPGSYPQQNWQNLVLVPESRTLPCWATTDGSAPQPLTGSRHWLETWPPGFSCCQIFEIWVSGPEVSTVKLCHVRNQSSCEEKHLLGSIKMEQFQGGQTHTCTYCFEEPCGISQGSQDH